ncbi:MAG TPA: condensation domain-containing protein, partial [Ktedonobacteraceae bacterium]|nr:condensation domain-containing protein [Ktedonobacteraceae bacterium]
MQEKVFEGYDLSPQQKHLWRLQQMVGMDQFRAWCAIQIEGRIDTQQLQHAIQLVTSRHEILRTVFHRIPNLLLPLQVIREELSGQIVYQDLRDHPVYETDALLTVAEANLARLPVDLTQGPQFQGILLTQSDEQHTLILHLSAFHADTVTLQLIAQELCDAYSLPAADLKDVPMQYADFSAWQNDTLESDEAEAGRAYWREHAPSSLSNSLPFGYISDKPATGAFAPLRASVSLAQNIQLFLTTGSTALKTTPDVLILAGWMVLLQRLNGHNEQLVGVTFDGRNYDELYGAVGLYARSLPISCSFDEHISFTNLVAQLQTIMQGAAEHQECFSWDQIKGRKDSSEPYFPLCFEFLEESTRVSGGGITFTLAAHSSYIDRFDIKLVCRRQQDSFHCEL